MAEGLVRTEEESRLKCKKCREILVKNPPNTFSLSEVCEGEDSNVYSINEDAVPDWISSLIEQGGWTKGKLICPSCGARIGGFDFVSGTKDPVYIVKSKVDFWSPVPPTAIVEPVRSTTNPPSSIPENLQSAIQTRENIQVVAESTRESSMDSALEQSESSEGEKSESTKEGSSSPANHTDDESSSTEDYSVGRSRRQIKKEKRRKRRREREKRRNKQRVPSNDRVEAKVRELLEGEPELEELSDELICPVCLDLLHEPFQTEPCRHIFCEPCLRRLGQKNPMNTKCPLCRTRIRFCKHIAATSREIRESHEALYLRRKKFERSTPVYSYPLPWTPGWRNLIRGRPLGGNRLLVENNNHGEYIRTILHQIPYYIPQVMFANIINILIFGFMIGFVELLPTILYTFLGGGRDADPDTNLTEPLQEGSGSSILMEETDSPPLEEIPAVIDDIGPEALDSTFYFVLFFLSILAAGIGQLIMLHDPGQRFGYRLSDVFLVICLTSLPLLIVPTLLPYRAQEGPYIGYILKKMISFVLEHFSFHTFILVIALACFVYHCEGNEDQILW